MGVHRKPSFEIGAMEKIYLLLGNKLDLIEIEDISIVVDNGKVSTYSRAKMAMYIYLKFFGPARILSLSILR